MSTKADNSVNIDHEASDSVISIVTEGVSAVSQTPVIFGVYVVVAVISLIYPSVSSFLSLLAGGIVVVMAYTTLGGRPENQTSFGVRLIVVAIAGLISGFVILLGLIFFIIPGIYLAVRLRLVIPAVMLEDSGPIEALSRSFTLTNDHTWTVFGVTLLLTVSSFVIVVIVFLTVGGIPSGSVDIGMFQETISISIAVSTVLISPIGASTNAVMYGLYRRRRS